MAHKVDITKKKVRGDTSVKVSNVGLDIDRGVGVKLLNVLAIFRSIHNSEIEIRNNSIYFVVFI